MSASEKLNVALSLAFGLPLLAVGLYLTLDALFELLSWWLG